MKLTNLTYYWTSVVASPITIHYMFGASLENFNLVDSSVNSKTIVYSQYATIHIDSVVTGKWLLIAIRTTTYTPITVSASVDASDVSL